MPTIGVTLFVHAVVILVKSTLNVLGISTRKMGAIKTGRKTGFAISGLVVFLVAGSIVYSLSLFVASGLKDSHATWKLGEAAVSKVGLDNSFFFVYQLNASTKSGSSY